MGRRCTVCHHPERAAIDRRLVSGEACAHLHREFGFSEASMLRHTKNHVQKPLRAAAIRAGAVGHAGAMVAKGDNDPAALLALSDLVGTMQRNLARLERAADEAEGEKARLALAALSGQVSRAVEVAAKVSGVGAAGKPQSPPFSITINIGRRQTLLLGTERHLERSWDIDEDSGVP
jgi:hypothetical protein